MQTVQEALDRLQRSPFRSGIHLDAADLSYIEEKGLDTVERHCADLIRTRLAPPHPKNDGKQTPMRGHPVFKAQHACACCCRGCLAKWYKVPHGRPLTEEEQRRIVRLLMAWIRREMGGLL